MRSIRSTACGAARAARAVRRGYRPRMRYHHMAVFVSDMERSLRCYRDLLGFEHLWDGELPDDRLRPETLDAIFRTTGARMRTVLLVSPESDDTFLELGQPLNPPVRPTDPEVLRYANVGLSELGFQVTGLDGWFEKVRAAGYETQTDHIWETPGFFRSFIFFDPDGVMVQLSEPITPLAEILDRRR